MDEIERRNRWRGMTVHERHDALFDTPRTTNSIENRATAPSLASLVRADPALPPEQLEEMARVRRSAQAYSQIRRELEREQQEAQQTRQAEHAVFRTTPLGQLMEARR
jgi:hypothetical protein